MKFEAMSEVSLKMILRILLFCWRVVKAEVSSMFVRQVDCNQLVINVISFPYVPLLHGSIAVS